VTRRRAHRPRAERPLVHELVDVPELAILAALVAVIDLVVDSIRAAHPELADHERPYWLPPPANVVILADRLLRQAARFRRAVDRYRVAVKPPPIAIATDDDVLF
jgi:hypothetical protein